MSKVEELKRSPLQYVVEVIGPVTTYGHTISHSTRLSTAGGRITISSGRKSGPAVGPKTDLRALTKN